jgi:hypothetical protein
VVVWMGVVGNGSGWMLHEGVEAEMNTMIATR